MTDYCDADYHALAARVLRAMADDSLAGDECFDALALDIHAFQRRCNRPYAAFCDLETDGAQPGHWSAIPPVPTDAFRFPRLPLATFPVARAVASFRTSGTTREIRGTHSFRSLDLYAASILGTWNTLGLPGHRRLALSVPPSRAPESSLVHMFGVLGCEFVSTVDADRIRSLAEPVILMGTALAFVALFERGAFPLPAGSLCVETGGYKGSGLMLAKHDLYARFAQHLGVDADAILNEYGMTELSSQFYSRGLGRAHTGPSWTRVRVMDPQSGIEAEVGRTGFLVIHDLANLGSVAAIATRDLAIRRRHGQFELLGRDPAATPRGCSLAARDFFPA